MTARARSRPSATTWLTNWSCTARPDYCRERVAEYQAAGLDTPVIAIVPVPGVDQAEAVRELAPA